MQKIFIGTVIRQRRKELGLTQEQLCEGICEPVTLSRLENGQQFPSQSRISALLERLDMPSDHHFSYVSKDYLKLDQLQEKIVSYNIRFDHAKQEDRPEIRAKAVALHKELESIMDKDDMISRQLILRSKVLLGKEDGSRYSLKEQLSMLTNAIRLTRPTFTIDEIGNGLYTVEEIKIINQLATTCGRADKHVDSIKILSQLYGYILKHFQNIPLYQAHFQMIAFNYSRELLVVKQYEKAIEVAKEGRRVCIEHGHYRLLPSLLAIMAEAYHFLGEEEMSFKLYRRAFYIYGSIEDENNAALIQADIQKYFGVTLEP